MKLEPKDARKASSKKETINLLKCFYDIKNDTASPMCKKDQNTKLILGERANPPMCFCGFPKYKWYSAIRSMLL